MNLSHTANSMKPVQAETSVPKPAALSPGERRELEIAFAQALAFSSDRQRNYAKADQLFQMCLCREPANPLIITAYLENLARWRTRSVRPTWRAWWYLRELGKSKFDGPLEKYRSLIAGASAHFSTQILSLLAATSQEMSEPLAEEAYLREILRRESNAAIAHRRLAEIRISQADFESARKHWELLPLAERTSSAEQCFTAIDEPISEPRLPDASSLHAVLGIAQELAGKKSFSKAEELLSQAQNTFGASFTLQEVREDVQLAQLEFQFTRMQELEKNGNQLAGKAKISLYQKRARFKLEITGARADRYPDDWEKRLNIVRELLAGENYFEAIRRLNESPSPPSGIFAAIAQRLLAETHQRLRQFDKAMATYSSLLSSENFAALSLEDQSKIRSQSDRLAAAMQPPG